MRTQAPATLRVVRDLDRRTWSRYVARHPGGNVFHTPEMFDVAARTAHHAPELWAAVSGGSDVLALLTPVRVRLRGGPLASLTTRAIAYGGVLHDDTAAGRTALRLLLEAYVARSGHGVLFTELRNLHDTGALGPLLADHGFCHEQHLNFVVDLDRPVEQVLQGIARRARQAIRKGLRDGQVRVRELTDRADLTSWYEVLAATYRNAGVPLADRTLFEAAFDVLRPAGMIRFRSAEVSGRVAACSADLQYKDTVYAWYGGSDRELRRWVPNEMIVWDVLARGVADGYRRYDFGGAGKPGEPYGVRDFKAKFGGDLVDFGRDVRVHSPLRLWVSRSGYRLYRRWMLAGRAARSPC
jgi:CelD/BcsL family acetyltransferase involved in cellulose biosynthesis